MAVRKLSKDVLKMASGLISPSGLAGHRRPLCSVPPVPVVSTRITVTRCCVQCPVQCPVSSSPVTVAPAQVCPHCLVLASWHKWRHHEYTQSPHVTTLYTGHHGVTVYIAPSYISYQQFTLCRQLTEDHRVIMIRLV